MKRQKSLLNLFYGSYFPELKSLGPNAEETSVSSPFTNDTRNNLIISTTGFTCKLTKYNGTFLEFYSLADSLPKNLNQKYFEIIKNRKFNYNLEQIKLWQKNLFLRKNIKVRDYLMSKRNIPEKVLKENFIGYDSDGKRIIYPYLNITGKGVSAIKFIKHDDDFTNFEGEMVGYPRLLGYKDIKFSVTASGQILIAKDEFDYLYLKNLGYSVVAGLSDSDEWFIDWNDPLKNKDIVIFCRDYPENKDIAEQFTKYSKSITQVTISGPISTKKISTKDLNEKIKAGINLDEKYFKKIELFEKYFNTVEENQSLNLPQDFINGKQYFGIKSGKNILVISSDSEILDTEQLKRFGIVPRRNLLDESRLSKKGVYQNLISNKKISSSNLLCNIEEYIKDYIFF